MLSLLFIIISISQINFNSYNNELAKKSYPVYFLDKQIPTILQEPIFVTLPAQATQSLDIYDDTIATDHSGYVNPVEKIIDMKDENKIFSLLNTIITSKESLPQHYFATFYNNLYQEALERRHIRTLFRFHCFNKYNPEYPNNKLERLNFLPSVSKKNLSKPFFRNGISIGHLLLQNNEHEAFKYWLMTAKADCGTIGESSCKVSSRNNLTILHLLCSRFEYDAYDLYTCIRIVLQRNPELKNIARGDGLTAVEILMQNHLLTDDQKQSILTLF